MPTWPIHLIWDWSQCSILGLTTQTSAELLNPMRWLGGKKLAGRPTVEPSQRKPSKGVLEQHRLGLLENSGR